MKVKLVFEKNFTEIKGLSGNSFAKMIDIELPQNMPNGAHLVSARTYDLVQASDRPSSDVTAVIWDYDDESRLVGKLLTYVDATYTDKEQRDAHKNLVKDLVYGYFSELRTRANQTIEAVKE